MALKGIFTGQSSWCTWNLGSNDLLTLMNLVALMFWLDFSKQHMTVSFLKREQKLRKCSHQVDLWTRCWHCLDQGLMWQVPSHSSTCHNSEGGPELVRKACWPNLKAEFFFGLFFSYCLQVPIPTFLSIGVWSEGYNCK